jgi:hypothetical protein
MIKQTTIPYGTKELVLTYKDGDIEIQMGRESTTISAWDFAQALRKIGIKRIPQNKNQCPI